MKPNVLYRHWDATGNLLYVGISLSAMRRIEDHKSNSSWFKEIKRVTFEWFPSRESVLEAEKIAIKRERPKYNKKHANSHDCGADPVIEDHGPIRFGNISIQPVAEPLRVTVREAAKLTGDTDSAILRAINSDELPAHRCGRGYRILFCDLREWVLAQARNPARHGQI